MFFEEYIVHYLSHCGVIPVQSLGSHVRPQPLGIGFKLAMRAMIAKMLLPPEFQTE